MPQRAERKIWEWVIPDGHVNFRTCTSQNASAQGEVFSFTWMFFLFVLLATMGKLLVLLLLLLFITKSISLANIGCVFLQPPNIKMKLEPQTTFRSQLPCRVVVL